MNRPLTAGMMQRKTRRRLSSGLLALVMLAATVALADPGATMAPARSDTVLVALVPPAHQFAAGDTFTVDVVVPVAGPQFNAYDAYVSYDPAVLTFLQADNIADQEGPLMREACYQTFHVFDIAPDSSFVEIHHVLLCNNTYLTGPGVLYQLKFQCNDVDADTRLDFLLEAPTRTRFFANGLFVDPLRAIGADIRVGEGDVTAAPEVGEARRLRAAPNPFNPRTTLSFTVAAPGAADLAVYDLAGRRVRRLLHGAVASGTHRMTWDGLDDAGAALPSGVYLARLRVAGESSVERLTLVR